jgi:hypothetical protein
VCYEGIYRHRLGRSFGSHPQANIDGANWDEPATYLANAGTGQLEQGYVIDPYEEY